MASKSKKYLQNEYIGLQIFKYIQIFTMKKEEEKVHGWMYKYICGPKTKWYVDKWIYGSLSDS